jgi:hypothetical protein
MFLVRRVIIFWRSSPRINCPFKPLAALRCASISDPWLDVESGSFAALKVVEIGAYGGKPASQVLHAETQGVGEDDQLKVPEGSDLALNLGHGYSVEVQSGELEFGGQVFLRPATRVACFPNPGSGRISKPPGHARSPLGT